MIKKVKDCTCDEIDCEVCPWHFRWEINEITGDVNYDKEAFNRCMYSPKEKIMQQIYDRYKNKLTYEQQVKIKRKLNKEIKLE